MLTQIECFARCIGIQALGDIHLMLGTQRLDNRFVRLSTDSHARAQPTPVPIPWLVCSSDDAVALLDISSKTLHQPRSIDILAGNAPLIGRDS